MEKRRLGTTDISLSVIGLGTWAIGGGDWAYGWGFQDDAASIACIHEAADLGINWIDTAAVYGIGRSESVVGKALKGLPGEMLIATKCGLFADKSGALYGKIKRASILKEVEESLKRLQVECIDIYQIHWPNPSDDIEEAFETLLSLKQQGKIRCASVSNFSRAQLERVSNLGAVDSLQSPYSILNRRVELDILPWCREHECGFLAYSPLQCGLLTGKVTREWVKNLPDDDWRKTKSDYFKEPGLSAVLNYVESLKSKLPAQFCDHPDWLCGSAIQWLIMQNGVTSVIVGARKKGQISAVVAAASHAAACVRNETLAQLEPAPMI